MIHEINKMIKEERDFINRKKNEITVDFPVIESEIKLEVLEKVKRLLQKEKA